MQIDSRSRTMTDNPGQVRSEQMQFKQLNDLFSRFSTSLSSLKRKDLAPVVLFLVNAFLLQSLFFPNFGDINPWDEASYLHRGMTFMVSGELPVYSANPLTTLFYGLTYLPFQSSPLWMIHSCSLSRLILFSLLWLTAYRVARELEAYAPATLTLGFMFVTTLTIRSMRFPSDPLFASLAGLSLSMLLRYRNTQRRGSLVWASIFMGLAAMARNDGLILFPILAALALLQAFQFREPGAAAIRIVLPFIVIVGGYLGIFTAVTGTFEMGTAGRTYDAFEVGHLVIMENLGEGEPVLQAPTAARAVFGTPEENNYNVFRAISRAPSVYLDRLIAAVKATPATFLLAYSRLAYLIPLLAVRGLIAFLRKRQYLLALAFSIWPAHLATSYVTTVIRQGHLIFPYYAAFALSAVGLWALIKELPHGSECWIWRAGFAAIVVFSVVDHHPSTGYVYGLAWITLEIIMLLKRAKPNAPAGQVLLVLLAAGLILRGSYPQPKLRELGQEAEEQALIVAARVLEPDMHVAAFAPGFAWALGTEYIGLGSQDTPITRSSEGFVEWLRTQSVQLIYIDTDLRQSSPTAWRLLQEQIGGQLSSLYSDDSGSVQVLEVNTENQSDGP